MSEAILATLGLRREDVGRFRDCFVADGEIAIYTRNGDGNRDCWHTDGEGNQNCENEFYVVNEEKFYSATKDEIEQHPEWKLTNFYEGDRRGVWTGEMVDVIHYKCLHPDSEKCSCPGCVISHRLPSHPCYLRDEDDFFDSTYATIYFKFPEEFADELKKLDIGEKFDPSDRWLGAIKTLERGLNSN